MCVCVCVCVCEIIVTRKQRGRNSVLCTLVNDVHVKKAIDVLASKRPPLPRYRFDCDSCTLQRRGPTLPHHPAAISVSSQL